jgi:hypothetical protein
VAIATSVTGGLHEVVSIEMKFAQMNNWLTLIANIGVILGLILVAYEVRQNSELMRVQINQARADSAMVNNEQSFNSDFIPPILVKVRRGDDLSAEERIRFTDYFRAMNRNQDNVLGQYDAGMLGENTPRSIVNFACQFIGTSKASQTAWEYTKGGYTDRYIEFIERTLESCE